MKKSFFLPFICAIVTIGLCSCVEQSNHKIQLSSEAAKEDYKEKITIIPLDDSVKIERNKIIISPHEEDLEYTISGYFNGQIICTTKNTSLKLKNAYLENKNGESAIRGEAKIEVLAAKDSVNYIVSSGNSFNKNAALQGKRGLVIGGGGILYVDGNVYHGVEAEDVKIKGSGTFYFEGTSEGSALKCKTFTSDEEKSFNAYFLNSKNGIKAENTIIINSGNYYLYENATALKTDTSAEKPSSAHSITLKGGEFHTYQNAKLYSTDENAYFAEGASFIED